MSLINANSPITLLKPMELFRPVPVQDHILSMITEKARPNSQLNTGGYIEIDVQSNTNEYIKLDDIMLYVKFRVKLKQDERRPITIEDWDKVSLVNNALHSLWNQVDLSINDIQTTISLLTYAQKSYFQTLLHSPSDARQTILELSGFYEDDELTHYNGLSVKRRELIEHPKAADYRAKKTKVQKTTTTATATTTTAENNLPTTPAEVQNGRTVVLSGKLNLDLLQQFKFLIGGTRLRFKLVQNRPEFIFMVSDTSLLPYIELEEVYLEIPKYIVSEDLYDAHHKAMAHGPARYPISRTEVKSHTIDRGVTQKNIENVVNGQMPKRIYVAMVENDSFMGNFSKNPFLFKHFDLFSIACCYHGKRIEYKPDFDQRITTEEYLSLLKAANQTDPSQAKTFVTKRRFDFGYTIFGFSLNQDFSQGYYDQHLSEGHVNFRTEGVVRFELIFRNPTQNVINILFYCTYDNIVCLTQERQRIVDF